MKKIALLVLLSILVVGCGKSTAIKVPFYIGTYTDGSSEGIYLSFFDEDKGVAEEPKLVFKLINPSFLSVSDDEKYLFAVSEKDDLTADLFSFKINEKDGELSLIDSVSTDGRGACFVSQINDNLIGVAHYNSGDVVFVSVFDGVFDKSKIQIFSFEGSSINKYRQESSHVHSVVADVEKNFAYVADLGSDNIYIFKLENESVFYLKNIKTKLGAGPRMVAFHPNGKIMSVINELDGTIVLYGKDESGIFTIEKSKFQLSADSENSWSADLKFSKNGDYLYASERADNKIAILKVEGFEVELAGEIFDKINVPRSFALSSNEKYIVVANQEGDNITLYKNEREYSFVQELRISKSVCVLF